MSELIMRQGSKLGFTYNKKTKSLDIYKVGLISPKLVAEVFTPFDAPLLVINVGLRPDEVRVILDEFLSAAGLAMAKAQD